MGRLMIAATAAVGAALTAGACAPAEPLSTADNALASGECFYASEIHTFHRADNGGVYVRSNRGDVYRLDAPGGCFDAGLAGLTIEPYVSASQRVCVGDQARVRAARSSSAPMTCIARVVGPVPDSEVSGLPSRPRS